MRYPEAGGTYVYGTRRLGPFWGYLAGWCFVIGKAASCAAMALTAAAYLLPAHPKFAALAFIVLLATTNYVGITRTARLARVLLLTLTSLACTLPAIWIGGPAAADTPSPDTGPPGVLTSADCCSSRSRGTRASPPSVRRSAIPSEPFHGRF